jgi:diphthamide biosynthesis protein 7
LDVHFFDRSSDSLFGVATSTGSIGLYNLKTPAEGVPRLVYKTTVQCFPEDVLVTAFSWHPGGRTLGMTLSSGKVVLGHIGEDISDAGPRHVESLTHDLEAWTLAFLPDGSGIFSGGDDCALRFTELSRDLDQILESGASGSELPPSSRMPWADKKIHGAGVTAILPVHCDDNGMLILTGSYDDHIRLVHASSVGRRQVLSELNLGGGVWRLKLLDRKPASRRPIETSDMYPEELLLLVSCMHAGARIVRLFQVGETWDFEVLAKFEEHKSMNYGSDCQPVPNEQGQRTFISTSFYDRLLCVWRY